MGCAMQSSMEPPLGSWHYMNWAQICSGSTSTITDSPFLYRTNARNIRVKLDLELPVGPVLPPNPVVSSNGNAENGPRLREKLFRFSEPSVHKIKWRVNSSPPSVDGGFKPFRHFNL
ncbi:hypothetical protein V6N13_021683 [Hibiscus sabdariffa]|uniref:Uncharacterized protein n=1 Tax=Hibiscus sabdariffa TaxID=183260 RepID=A0ABR2B9Y5_9ROSI